MQLPRAHASDGEAFFVPSPSLLDEITESIGAIEPGPHSTADSCTFDDEWRCQCLRSGDTSVGAWEPSVARDVVVDRDEARFYLRTFTPGTNTFTGLVAVGASGVFSASSGRRVDGVWILEDLSFSGEAVSREEVSCGAEHPEVDEEATAERAVETEGGFELMNYRAGIWPVGDVSPGVRESGLLPPTVRATPEAVEFEAATYFAPVGAATLTTAPGKWYGAGVRIFGDGALDLQGRYDVDEGLVPFAWGETGFGSQRQRLDVTLEHPAQARHADLRQLENGSFLRPWSRSAMGINLSGPSYGFAVEGGWLSRPDGTTDGDLVASFGGHSSFGEHVELDFDLQQYSRTVESSSTHSSTAALRVTTPIGDRTAIWLTPGAGAYANYGVIPAELGFEASASGGVFVDLSTGASWTGRFEGFSHTFGPEIRAGKEVVGISQRAPLPDDAPNFLFTRVPRFGWAVAELVNRFDFEDWSLALPLGTAGMGPGLGDLVPARPYAGPRLEAGAFRVESGAICGEECDSVGGLLAISGAWSRLDGSVTLVDGSVDEMRVLSGARGFSNPIEFLLRSAPASMLSQRWGHAGIGWSISSLRLHAALATTPDNLIGATGGATWQIDALGFGVTALGGWRNADDTWNAMVGFAL